jgi:uncharacterized protein with von Willebrand factor type A (vWA) domain
LRALGIDVTPTQIIDLVEGLKYIDVRRREDFKNSARTVLVSRREQLPLFDRAFDLFWQGREEDKWARVDPCRPMPQASPGQRQEFTFAKSGDDGHGPGGEGGEPKVEELYIYSPQEILRHKDFAEMSPDELCAVKSLLRGMSWEFEQRRTRRKAHAPHGAYLDMRRTLRQNLRYGGEPLRFAWQRRKQKRRPLVVICDISGSMESYSRILLQFIYVISNGLKKVEAFVFGTRLTRITHHLKERDVDEALERATNAVQDWAGGTRIGEALKTFNYVWGRRVLGQGAIVLIISDGLDCGDIPLLELEMHRLRLSCRRLIWLNPLLGCANYEPLTRGMVAALPYIDDFRPVHNLESLEQLGHLLQCQHPFGQRRHPPGYPAKNEK